MNKRIKKKWSRVEALENQVTHLVMDNLDLKHAILRQQAILEKMQQINSRNIIAINNRFDALETYQQVSEDDVKELKKTKKKGFFSRK